MPDEIVDEVVEPEVPEADAEITEGEAAEIEESEEKDTPSESSTEKPKKDFQTRIDELTSDKHSLKDANTALERERDHWREQANKQPEHKPEIKLELKSLAEFDYDESAYQAHVLEVSQQATLGAVDEARQHETANTKQTTFSQKESEFAKDKPDYFEKAHDRNLRISEAMVNVAMESDEGPAILYHLSEHPDLALRLSGLPERTVGLEFGKIIAKLGMPADKSTTKAPDPAPKIEGSNSVINIRADSPDSDKLSSKEWLKKREKQLASK